MGDLYTAGGAAPAGVSPGDEARAARAIREMFGQVAPRYDLLNHLLSVQIDRYWRRRLVNAVRPYLERDGSRVADLCCGTGDLALAFAREHRRLRPDGELIGFASDFCRPMMIRAAEKLRREGVSLMLAEADATRMPLPDGCLDLIAIAYGFRNLANYKRGTKEFKRLIAPGGCLAILEFARPTSRIWGRLFNAYFKHVLPRLGNAISGSGKAYSYLHESVGRFPEPEEILDLLAGAGFSPVRAHPLTGGISVLYLAYS